MQINHKGRDIAELNTLYTEETVGAKSKTSTPTLITTPRTAPRTISANKSAFQLFTLEVKKRATATTGAMDPWAMSARIDQLKKSFEPVLA
jgi:hypothetical protein